MKKILFPILILVIILGMSNCQDNEENEISPLIGTWLSEDEVPADVNNSVGSIYSKYVFNEDGTFENEYKEKSRDLPPGDPWIMQVYMSGTYKDKKTSFQLFSESFEIGTGTFDYTIDNDGKLILYIHRLQYKFSHTKIN